MATTLLSTQYPYYGNTHITGIAIKILILQKINNVDSHREWLYTEYADQSFNVFFIVARLNP